MSDEETYPPVKEFEHWALKRLKEKSCELCSAPGPSYCFEACRKCFFKEHKNG